ncbi:MAG: LLM class flavin-dependent oxidoreductase, partial [Alphaproteobacteria bacterium]|nr:LLM class flavin-dependent oxidoreductase [Alphaproteobacteria bacterium]
YYSQLYRKLKKSNRHGVFKHYRDEPDENVTLDRILDDTVISGTVDKVVDEILAFREATGDFGEIVYAGVDFADAELAKRSIELMATEVMPRVNEAIGRSQAAE